jgi:hypothetical protein
MAYSFICAIFNRLPVDLPHWTASNIRKYKKPAYLHNRLEQKGLVAGIIYIFMYKHTQLIHTLKIAYHEICTNS